MRFLPPNRSVIKHKTPQRLCLERFRLKGFCSDFRKILYVCIQCLSQSALRKDKTIYLILPNFYLKKPPSKIWRFFILLLPDTIPEMYSPCNQSCERTLTIPYLAVGVTTEGRCVKSR